MGPVSLLSRYRRRCSQADAVIAEGHGQRNAMAMAESTFGQGDREHGHAAAQKQDIAESGVHADLALLS